MKKALIIGGAGFIGYHLAKKLLESDYQIDILDNFSITFRNKLIEHRHFSILNKIDPFRDSRGPNRVGKFIQDYMDYINYNINHDEALVKACDNYKADNGEDYVINAFNGTNNIISTKNLWTEIPLIEEQKVVF